MSEITTVGLDLAKNVFQLHGADRHGHQKLSRQVKRAQLMSTIAQLPPCTIAMEACAGQQRLQTSNQVRGLLAEFGIAIPVGLATLRRRLPELLEDAENDLPDLVRPILSDQYQALRALDERLASMNKQIEGLARGSEPCKRLMEHMGVGALIATCFVASVGSPQAYKNGRQVAAWLGLVPKQHSSGGKPTLLGISKRGDTYLRSLLIHGARSALKVAARHDTSVSRWALGVQERRGVQRATVALANKMARRLWANLAYESFVA